MSAAQIVAESDDQAPNLTLPTIHTNGTSAEMLTDGYAEAASAVRSAMDAIGKIEFNGRDYYPQGPEAYKKARAEHGARLQRLQDVHDELMAIAIHCSDFRKG